MKVTVQYTGDDTPQDWFFTFGGGHPFRNQFVVIRGTFGDARKEMFRRRGGDWCGQYTADEFAGQPEQYGLTRLMNDPAEWQATHVFCDAFGKRTRDVVMLKDGQFIGYGAWTSGKCVGSMASIPATTVEEFAPGRVRALDDVRADEQAADAIESFGRHFSDACCDECNQHITECCCRDEPRDNDGEPEITFRERCEMNEREFRGLR